MPRQFSSFNFVALIAILLFSLMLIAAQPRGKFSSPAPPEIQSVSIQPNENVYVYGIGKIAQLDSTGAKYFHSDYLGTPRVETNANKNIVASNNQYPFGEKLSQQGAEKYTFTGKELDDTGLQYFGARFYDSSSGRFTQVDPVGAGYIYSNNNPLRFVDPTGNEEWSAVNPNYNNYIPFLTSAPAGYQSPIKLLFSGHPVRAAQQYALNLQQAQTWRWFDPVDLVATSKEVFRGKTNPIWLLAFAAPIAGGSGDAFEQYLKQTGSKVTGTLPSNIIGYVRTSLMNFYNIINKGGPPQHIAIDINNPTDIVKALNIIAVTQRATDLGGEILELKRTIARLEADLAAVTRAHADAFDAGTDVGAQLNALANRNTITRNLALAQSQLEEKMSHLENINANLARQGVDVELVPLDVKTAAPK